VAAFDELDGVRMTSASRRAPTERDVEGSGEGLYRLPGGQRVRVTWDGGGYELEYLSPFVRRLTCGTQGIADFFAKAVRLGDE
jgi:hypothetical protein